MPATWELPDLTNLSPSPAAAAAAAPSGLARVLPTLSLPPRNACCSYRERARPPPAGFPSSFCLARSPHTVSPRVQFSEKCGFWLPKPATPLPATPPRSPASGTSLLPAAFAPRACAGFQLGPAPRAGGACARPRPCCARGVTLGASGAARAQDPEPRAPERRWRPRRVPGPAG